MSGKTNINVYVPRNNNLFIAIISVFLLFSLLLYSYPPLFIFLFNNILGNLLLAVGVIGVGIFDVRWAIGLAAIFVILYQAFKLNNASLNTASLNTASLKEGFTNWSPQLITDFKNLKKQITLIFSLT
jgi:hypothetical protein